MWPATWTQLRAVSAPTVCGPKRAQHHNRVVVILQCRMLPCHRHCAPNTVKVCFRTNHRKLWTHCCVQSIAAACRKLVCELTQGNIIVYDPSNETALSVSDEYFEAQCGASITTQVLTTRSCNMQPCGGGHWIAGPWGQCKAQCGEVGNNLSPAQGSQTRTIWCTDLPCSTARPEDTRSCTLPCDACTQLPCGLGGTCECASAVGNL